MTQAKADRRRQRGTVDELPSGALRVRVYAGRDPVSGKRNDLVEIIEPGPGGTRYAARVVAGDPSDIGTVRDHFKRDRSG